MKTRKNFIRYKKKIKHNPLSQYQVHKTDLISELLFQMASRHISIFLSLMFLFFSNAIFAAAPIEFFSSNNTGVIDMQQAYKRLTGDDQRRLQQNIINVMQKNHIAQGHFEDVLGMYYLSSNQKMTADNTQVFNSSSNQIIPEEKIFALAKQLATSLNQESIAVFIPSEQQAIGEIKLSFTEEPFINDALKLIKEKLPSIYLQAFSLHLMNECNQFDRAKVSSIEWLGSKLKRDEVKKAFPHEKVTSQSGSIFLVYQNGRKEKL